jgi:heme exporter protein D
MDLATLAFSGFLLLLALGLGLSHVRAWRADRDGDDQAPEYSYARRKFRRRMQVSVMVGVTGAAILIGQLFTDPRVVGIYWIAVMVWVIWIVTLAVADLLDTRRFLEDLHREQLVLNAQLQAELQRRRHEGNGNAHKAAGERDGAR